MYKVWLQQIKQNTQYSRTTQNQKQQTFIHKNTIESIMLQQSFNLLQEQSRPVKKCSIRFSRIIVAMNLHIILYMYCWILIEPACGRYQMVEMQVKVKDYVDDYQVQALSLNKPNLLTDQPASKTLLQNYMNIQYFLNIYVGSPGQKQTIMLDTGSSLLWVPSVNCTGCSRYTKRFNPSKSLTFISLGTRNEIRYVKGYVAGGDAQDFVSFQNFKSFSNILIADVERDVQGQMFDGIMGLSNNPRTPNIFQIAKQTNILTSSTFAFKLGLKHLNQKSYFYYNISKQDFPQAHYIKASKSYQWTIPLSGMYVNQKKYSVYEALIDTGTSFTMLPMKPFYELQRDVFVDKCSAYDGSDKVRECNCDVGSYPNITFISSGLQFNLTPDMYLFGARYSKTCYLAIQTSALINSAILGDNFLQQNFVIFNKQQNTLGFIGNYKKLQSYIQSNWILVVFDVLEVAVLLGLGLLIWKVLGDTGVYVGEGQQDGKGKGMLREPLYADNNQGGKYFQGNAINAYGLNQSISQDIGDRKSTNNNLKTNPYPKPQQKSVQSMRLEAQNSSINPTSINAEPESTGNKYKSKNAKSKSGKRNNMNSQKQIQIV